MYSKQLRRDLELSFSLCARDVKTRYKGSILGWLWTLITPLMMLVVYTFIFGFVFKSKWSGDELDQYSFAINLFIGMLFFGYFSECFTRAPSTIYSNRNYVKKLVFRLEVLPLVNVLSSAFHLITGLLIWIAMILCVSSYPIDFYKLFDLILLILALSVITLGISYYLSAIGAYIRDLNQICVSLNTLLLFISPVFYNSKHLPSSISNIIMLNPISFPILEARSIILDGNSLNYSDFFIYLSLSFMVLASGYILFVRLKKGFVDVV